MNAFIPLFVASLAIAAQAGHVSSSWPVTTYAVDSWNGLNNWNGLNTWNGFNHWNGLNSWNGLNTWNHQAAYPYGANQWTTAAAWPANSAYNGWYGKVTPFVQPTIAKVNPWGLPLAHTGYGYGYNNYLGAAKYVATNPGSVHVASLVGHAVNQKVIVA
ncbi:hypothetical protein pipiens_010264 [Culex pipiens pipiens]|uniref:Uncharacterized protein n=1 Tax=Culex pipiens pipiens TaxID=38569 RepID=A0ABD1DAV7_CULPP